MGKPRTKEKPEFGTWFGCMTCGTSETKDFSREQFVEHLKTVHKLESPIKGNRKMELHIDMADHYISTYEWVFGEVRGAQETVGPRGGR